MALHGPVGISKSGFFNYRHSPFTKTVIKGAAMDNWKNFLDVFSASHSSKDIKNYCPGQWFSTFESK